ncbi:hypothetical protein NKI25_06785 [Mesorhizobium sp. M0808]|uniref:hypothetical protein n=1 Tax=unclassified Mesorhizobium TaxID=325217 RepID=UPI00333B5269
MRIATDEEADDVIDDGKDPAAKALGAKGGKKPAPIAGQRFDNVVNFRPPVIPASPHCAARSHQRPKA